MRSIKTQYWSAHERYQEYAKRKKFIRDNHGDMCTCNLCGWSGSFWYQKCMGQNIITKVCPKCDSKPRQRILKAVLEKEDIVNHNSQVIHVSPQGERGISKWMCSKTSNYLSIDIESGKAMKTMDLTSLSIKDNTVDIVVCCHVLEHIEADTLAIKEIYRVLKSGGIAIFQVPVYGERTEKVAKPTLQDHFHVWHPGNDYPRRYEIAGFQVRRIKIDEIDMTLCNRLSLTKEDTVELCVKPE